MDNPPLPGTEWCGDGLSGFRRIQITDHTWDGEYIYFFPLTAGWRENFLTYQLPLEVFHRVYSPCANPPAENSFSKTVSRWLRPFSSLAARCWPGKRGKTDKP
jgi:hypothetical protein